MKYEVWIKAQVEVEAENETAACTAAIAQFCADDVVNITAFPETLEEDGRLQDALESIAAGRTLDEHLNQYKNHREENAAAFAKAMQSD